MTCSLLRMRCSLLRSHLGLITTSVKMRRSKLVVISAWARTVSGLPSILLLILPPVFSCLRTSMLSTGKTEKAESPLFLFLSSLLLFAFFLSIATLIVIARSRRRALATWMNPERPGYSPIKHKFLSNRKHRPFYVEAETVEIFSNNNRYISLCLCHFTSNTDTYDFPFFPVLFRFNLQLVVIRHGYYPVREKLLPSPSSRRKATPFYFWPPSLKRGWSNTHEVGYKWPTW